MRIDNDILIKLFNIVQPYLRVCASKDIHDQRRQKQKIEKYVNDVWDKDGRV